VHPCRKAIQGSKALVKEVKSGLHRNLRQIVRKDMQPMHHRFRGSPRALLRGLFDAAVASTHPAQTLPAFLPAPPAGTGRILLLSTGKAGGSMMTAAVRHYLDAGLAPDRLFGLATARHGYEGRNALLPEISAGHPVPDSGSIEAAERALALAASARPHDLAIALISGGGSANWVAPAKGLTLDIKQKVNRALLRSGAAIDEMNCVRKHLSRIKGGRLAAALGTPNLTTLAISDVPGDDPSTIASGPTVADPTTLADARRILERRGVAVPPEVMATLSDPANETPKPGSALFARHRFEIISRPRDGLEAAIRMAEDLGLAVISKGPDLEGEARLVAEQHGAEALSLAGAGRPVLILSGGELTVTIRGQGTGGPNQEYALALALALKGQKGIHALAGDTDGTDGGGGDPADPAGAYVSPDSLARAGALGLDAQAMLLDNNSTPFFRALGDTLDTGPTLTNANDLRAILIWPEAA
jgi:glycerate 2-kinase